MTAAPTQSPTPSRHLTLEGVDNIRDLGGLHTADGRRTKRGLLLRSSAVHEVTDADAKQLAQQHGVRLVIDLRSPNEIDKTGRGLLSRHIAAYVNLPILATGELAASTLVDARHGSMLGHYLAYLENSHAQFAIAVRLLASPAHLPALFHCAAGKDRTGTLAALVLDALGVKHDEIIADYALTRERMPSLIERLRRDAFHRHTLETVPAYALDADPATMAELLAHLQQHHGGAAAWLQAHGLEADVIDKLRSTLLE